MTRAELTEKLLDIKREKGWTWKYICGEIGGMSPVLVTGAVLGQMKMTMKGPPRLGDHHRLPDQRALGLPHEQRLVQAQRHRGSDRRQEHEGVRA